MCRSARGRRTPAPLAVTGSASRAPQSKEDGLHLTVPTLLLNILSGPVLSGLQPAGSFQGSVAAVHHPERHQTQVCRCQVLEKGGPDEGVILCLPERDLLPDGVFETPFLFLHGGSNNEFQNLIAFEQSCRDLPEDEHYYTCYCELMGYLIDTVADVSVLEEHGSFSNFMGNVDETTKLFDKVGKGATSNHLNNCYLQVLKNVTKYCMSDFHRWWTRLVHDYFDNP